MTNTAQEFKVGDKVKYKKGENPRSNGHDFDKIYTISEILHNFLQIGNTIVQFEESDNGCYPARLELAEQPEKHIHHDLIIAWAKDPKGCIIQWRNPSGDWSWSDCNANKPGWDNKLEYRIKPRTKIKKYKYSLSYTGNGVLHTADHYSDEEWQQRLKENPTKFFTRLEWTEKEFEEV